MEGLRQQLAARFESAEAEKQRSDPEYRQCATTRNALRSLWELDVHDLQNVSVGSIAPNGKFVIVAGRTGQVQVLKRPLNSNKPSRRVGHFDLPSLLALDINEAGDVVATQQDAVSVYCSSLITGTYSPHGQWRDQDAWKDDALRIKSARWKGDAVEVHMSDESTRLLQVQNNRHGCPALVET